MTNKQPSQTWECIPCEQTYFAGAHAGPGPFVCEVCARELTRRPEGAEPYAAAVVVAEPTVRPTAQMEMGL